MKIVFDIISSQTFDSNKKNFIRLKSALFSKKKKHLIFNVLIPFLWPVAEIHFINTNNYSFCPERSGQHRMLSCLTGFLKSRFEFSGSCRNNQNCQICLPSSFNHVLNVISMSRAIKNCKSSLICFKICFSYFYGNCLFSFLFILVHYVCSPPSRSSFGLCLLFEFLNLDFINNSWLY